MVATWADVRPGRRYVYVDHGAGQTYGGRPSLDSAPSSCRCNVDVILCASEWFAALNRIHHPHAVVAAVGSPRMDRHHRAGYQPEPNLVAFAWHWRSTGLAPEADWAFPHWRGAVADLARRGVPMIGHGHPHAWHHLKPWYRAHGIPAAEDSATVFERASVLCFDNTSMGVEFASLDRPVVLLDAPWYRHGANHGGRFWEWADMGVRISSGAADDLAEAIERSLAEDPCGERRRQVVAEVYGSCDGQAAARAAEVIAAYLNP